MISNEELRAIAFGYSIGLGVAAGLEGFNSLQPPKNVETLVNKNPDPQVGEVVQARNIAIFPHSSVVGVGRRMPIGTTAVHMSFTDEQGRDMTAVLKSVDRPAQPAPNVEDFDSYYVEGCKLKIESIDERGLLKVTKLASEAVE